MLAMREEGYWSTYRIDEAVHIGSDFWVDRLGLREGVGALHGERAGSCVLQRRSDMVKIFRSSASPKVRDDDDAKDPSPRSPKNLREDPLERSEL